MDIDQIKNALEDSDPQQRMKGIRELRHYEVDIATPLLLAHVDDREFLVRSFVAMGLGKKRNSQSFAGLLTMMEFDSDPNVRAEAANSLSFFGAKAIAHLRQMYEQDDHWLVRRSIIAALADLDCPQELWEVCAIGLRGDDLPVKESCISCLGLLAKTELQEEGLKSLLSLVEDRSWRIRVQVAKSLGKYNHPDAITALNKLKADQDHRVVGAVLESLV
ncbi:HEAT repeat domain-containing protein [Pleurocapsa sp. PCC 7319]|uniref:HEAT repeat domain-containing protein n=1 Tax=Pleurocapsa sp. PCC 7319 TaxID=118161 RepID=UPI00034B2053|nr:HEAT repeat domain-containing protein [Pleurocapsa sp. PCC 7319]